MVTERLTTPPHWTELLKTALELPGQAGSTYNRFRRFSLGNQALLMMQGLMEPVNTYKGWLALNRQVKRGSKAKVIYVPMFRKELKDDGEKEQRLSGFKLVPSIFGFSETEGDDLPEYEPPTWSKERAISTLKVTQVAYATIEGNAQGYSVGRQFAINPVAVYPFKTMLHELGHIVSGHTTADGLDEYRTHRGIKEFEAEASAYLLMNELDSLDEFNAPESRDYIQTWLRGEDPHESSIKRVFSTVDKIYRAGLDEPEDSEPASSNPEVTALAA
ncbi:ArdC-like ssDNA-binding domain-containing protein [Arthrobacter sp. M-10]|uniref:ArdC-like ssDNA-binding domain-containing protein n=1 Tax=Arthrobacter sp. M-10 TaxID=3233037 RepID=UPI003F912C77